MTAETQKIYLHFLLSLFLSCVYFFMLIISDHGIERVVLFYFMYVDLRENNRILLKRKLIPNLVNVQSNSIHPLYA